MCGGSFGSGGFGSMGFGSGAGLFVLRAEQQALNAILVTFSGIPDANDPATSWDALNPDNWTIEPRSPHGLAARLVQFVERGPTSEQIRVYADGPLDARAVYRVIASATLRDASGAPIDPSLVCRAADFETRGATRVVPGAALTDPPTDLANPQTTFDEAGALLGTYQISDQGDFANETGAPYLRKRILRRASAALGGFFHLADYGFMEPVKGTIRPSLIARLQARAQSQIMREPDVAACSVRVYQVRPGVVVLAIRAQDTGGSTVEMTVPVPLGGSAG